MKRVITLLVIISSTLLGAATNAQTRKHHTEQKISAPLKLENMAASVVVIPKKGGGSLQRFALPAELLVQSQSTDLHDIRVFDLAGQPLPFALVASDKEVVERLERTVTLKSFPIMDVSSPERLMDTTSVRIVGEGDRAVVTVDRGGVTKPKTPAQSHSNLRVVGALLDAREVSGIMTGITLDVDLLANTVMPITIEASRDLRDWQLVASAQSIYQFEGAGAPASKTIDLLTQNRIGIANAQSIEGKYVRITWPLSLKTSDNDAAVHNAVTLRSATLRLEATKRSTAPVTRYTLGTPIDSTSHSSVWSLGFATRIKSLALSTEQTGTLLPVTVSGRDKTEQPWKPIAGAVVFRLDTLSSTGSGQPAQLIKITNAPINMNSASTRFMKIEAAQNTPGVAPAKLAAVVEFEPYEVVLATKGNEPITIATGALKAVNIALPITTIVPGGASQSPLPFVVTDNKVQVNAKPAEVETLTGTVTPIDAKQWTLWGALFLGVAALGAMAYAALRQLKNN